MPPAILFHGSPRHLRLRPAFHRAGIDSGTRDNHSRSRGIPRLANKGRPFNSATTPSEDGAKGSAVDFAGSETPFGGRVTFVSHCTADRALPFSTPSQLELDTILHARLGYLPIQLSGDNTLALLNRVFSRFSSGFFSLAVGVTCSSRA